ncbi:MAG: hypothetical protein Q9225_005905 [Loekoesia sp. 1 TL-2023]
MHCVHEKADRTNQNRSQQEYQTPGSLQRLRSTDEPDANAIDVHERSVVEHRHSRRRSRSRSPSRSSISRNRRRHRSRSTPRHRRRSSRSLSIRRSRSPSSRHSNHSTLGRYGAAHPTAVPGMFPGFAAAPNPAFGYTYGTPHLFPYLQPYATQYDTIYGNPYGTMFGNAYGLPQAPLYGPPQAPLYGAPQPPLYGLPQAPLYGAPQPPLYGAPQPPLHGTPPGGLYAAPYTGGGAQQTIAAPPSATSSAPQPPTQAAASPSPPAVTDPELIKGQLLRSLANFTEEFKADIVSQRRRSDPWFAQRTATMDTHPTEEINPSLALANLHQAANELISLDQMETDWNTFDNDLRRSIQAGDARGDSDGIKGYLTGIARQARERHAERCSLYQERVRQAFERMTASVDSHQAISADELPEVPSGFKYPPD